MKFANEKNYKIFLKTSWETTGVNCSCGAIVSLTYKDLHFRGKGYHPVAYCMCCSDEIFVKLTGEETAFFTYIQKRRDKWKRVIRSWKAKQNESTEQLSIWQRLTQSDMSG